jgi:hypothetical protein
MKPSILAEKSPSNSISQGDSQAAVSVRERSHSFLVKHAWGQHRPGEGAGRSVDPHRSAAARLGGRQDGRDPCECHAQGHGGTGCPVATAQLSVCVCVCGRCELFRKACAIKEIPNVRFSRVLYILSLPIDSMLYSRVVGVDLPALAVGLCSRSDEATDYRP